MKYFAVLILATLAVSSIATLGDAAKISSNNKKTESTNEESSDSSSSSSSKSSSSQSSSKSNVQIGSDGQRQETYENNNAVNEESEAQEQSSSNSLKSSSNTEEKNLDISVENPTIVVEAESQPQVVNTRAWRPPNIQISPQQASSMSDIIVENLSLLYAGISSLQSDIQATQAAMEQLNENVMNSMIITVDSLNDLVNTINNMIEDTNYITEAYNYFADQANEN